MCGYRLRARLETAVEAGFVERLIERIRCGGGNVAMNSRRVVSGR